MRLVAILAVLWASPCFGQCAGDECWPFDVKFTGYVTEPFQMIAPDCDPFPELQLSIWGGQKDGAPIGGGFWLSGGPESWEWLRSKSDFYGIDGLAAYNLEFWINRPDGSGGWLDSYVVGMEIKPTGNFFDVWTGDGCIYRARDVPYRISGEQVMGDSNFDGVFDSGDLVAAFVAGKYEQDLDAGWEEGDWAVDHRFDSSDFVAALTYGNYDNGLSADAVAVPEPSAAVLLGCGVLLLHRRLFRNSQAAV